MKGQFRNHIIYILLLTVLSVGYFVDTFKPNVQDTVSDQWNFIPIAIKLDHPELYKGDLFLDNIEDVKYYTPFFINGIRFFTYFTNDNYFSGLNLFNLFINLSFSIAWYLLFFKIFKNQAFAFLFSLILRGVMWLPGYEVWGAGPVWLALPRTAFIALLPSVFILLFFAKNKRYSAYFVLGLIANFHPISGLGIFVTIFLSDLTVLRDKNDTFKRNLIIYSLCTLFFILGCATYIYTYLHSVILNSVTDPVQFELALSMRIGEIFTNPFMILSKFTELKWLLLILTPYLLLIFTYKKLEDSDRRIVKLLMFFSLYILLFSVGVVPLEMLINRFGFNLHMSFQLVRNIKFIVVPVFILYAYFVFVLFRLGENSKMSRIKNFTLLASFILVLIFSRFQPLKSVPLVGDDFIRATMPNLYSIRKESLPFDKDLSEALNWINDSIKVKAKFVGPASMRSECRQSVVFDTKGASMLIEGNPNKFSEWGRRKIELSNTADSNKKIQLFKAWGAEYLLTKEYFEANLIFQNEGYRLYRL
jgi:hypothetical protein